MSRRGPWYHVSWKGKPERSGTLAMNVGIHFFDLLQWLFGPPVENHVHLRQADRFAGTLRLERARVRWFLSIAADDLPAAVVEEGGYAYRSITMNGAEIEFSTGFTDLHTRVYEDILAGGGYGLEEARPAIELVHEVRNVELSMPTGEPHPSLVRHLS
jgi:UDP-N-acetyl-2-amino-2-deoxyglucuronate dehydrogenase